MRRVRPGEVAGEPAGPWSGAGAGLPGAGAHAAGARHGLGRGGLTRSHRRRPSSIAAPIEQRRPAVDGVGAGTRVGHHRVPASDHDYAAGALRMTRLSIGPRTHRIGAPTMTEAVRTQARP